MANGSALAASRLIGSSAGSLPSSHSSRLEAGLPWSRLLTAAARTGTLTAIRRSTDARIFQRKSGRHGSPQAVPDKCRLQNAQLFHKAAQQVGLGI